MPAPDARAAAQHKLGADRKEACLAVPVDPANRLADLGPAREIEVGRPDGDVWALADARAQAWTAYDFPGRGDKHSALRWTHEHFSGACAIPLLPAPRADEHHQGSIGTIVLARTACSALRAVHTKAGRGG
jgi:hypothetical protein